MRQALKALGFTDPVPSAESKPGDHRRIAFCAPTSTQRCAGEGELLFAPTQHDPMLPSGTRDVKRQVLPILPGFLPGLAALG